MSHTFMEALIREGCGHYAAHKYDRALKQFTRAMMLCPCTQGLKRPRCTCKDFEAVAAENGSIFDEAMHTCACGVGKTFGKCGNALHIKALDYRAGTFEALKELGRARRDAEWMLELSPRMPDGYLRLGKIARLQNKAELSWRVYAAGVAASRDTQEGGCRKLRQLREALEPLQRRYARRDPVWLPAEIAYMIFAYLDVVELTNCVRVSRAWAGALQDPVYKGLWSALVFPRRRFQPPSNTALQKLLARARGGMRELEIADPGRFQLTPQKLTTLMRSSQALERLVLGPLTDYYFVFPKGPGLYQRLRHVALDTYNCREHRRWHREDESAGSVPVDFIKNIALTIEHLDLVGVPASWCMRQDVPDFPRLRHLRLERRRGPLEEPLPIFYMAAKTPRLEQLSLRNVHLNCNDMREWAATWATLWRRLEAFAFAMPEAGTVAQSSETLRAVTSLVGLAAAAFRHLDLDVPYTNDGDPATDELFTSTPDWASLGLAGAAHGLPPPHRVRLPLLRELRLRAFVHVPSQMHDLLQGPVRDGALAALDIVFPLDSMAGDVARRHCDHLAAYGWLRGLASVRCLGLWRFRFRQYPRSDDDLPLPAFLASFPNLEVLSLGSEYYDDDELGSVVEAAMRAAPRLHTLYQDGIRGAPWARLVAVGERHGVRVVSGARPRQWPVVAAQQQQEA